MKKLFSIICLCFVLFGCPEPKPEDTSNLSESKGTNELSGKTFQNDTTQFVFEDSTVAVNKNATATSRSTTSGTFEENTLFNYSYDSTSSEKKLEYQLKAVFQDDISMDYKKQLETAKDTCSTALSQVKELLSDDTLYPNASNYKETVKNAVIKKAQEYMNAQKNLLNSYLADKYESVITFIYTLENNLLTLKEQFKNDLSDASSKFTYEAENLTVILNDYDEVIPFKIDIEGSLYVGIPQFSNPTEASGTVEILLYPYSADFLSDTAVTIATKTNTLVTEAYTAIWNESSNESLEIVGELAQGKSSKLEALLDKELGKQTLKASYKVTIEEDSAKLTLSITEKPEYLAALPEEIVLNHTPVLETTLTLVQ